MLHLGKIRVTDGYLGNKVAVFYVYLHLTIVSPLVYMLMKKTVFSFVLVFIGICVALNGFAQNDKVSTFNLKLHDEPGYKLVMTVNPSQKEITQRVNDGEVRRINYYDYSIVQIGDINIGNFSFSLIPDIKAPKTGDECLTSEYYVFIGLNAVIVSLAKNRVLAFDYDMPKDKKVDQLAILTGNLLGLEPEKNSSSSSKSSSSTASKPVTTNKATSSSLINVPALPKEMTEMQMVMHPFGVLTDNLEGYTQEKVAKDLTTLFTDNVSTYETTLVTVTNQNNKGYDMSYKGYPASSCYCYFSDGKLESYCFSFHFLKDKFSPEQAISIAKAFISKLVDSKSFVDQKAYGDSLFKASLEGLGREINVRVHSAGYRVKDDSWGLFIDIRGLSR